MLMREREIKPILPNNYLAKTITIIVTNNNYFFDLSNTCFKSLDSVSLPKMVLYTLYCTRISFTSKEITMQVVTEILDSTALSLKRVSSVASFISK